ARSLPELFADQVRLTPAAPALIFGDRQWTFAELDRWSNKLAFFFQIAGFGQEQVAAILMDRCPEMVVAILGVIRAGGAWLPLDPAHPVERLNYMISDSRALMILGKGPDPKTFTAPWVAVDQLPHAAREIPWEAPDPRSLAYLIYTSGSTGR